MLRDGVPRKSIPQAAFSCHVCGMIETKTGPNQKCCQRCRPDRWLKYYRDYQRRRPKRGVRALGDTAACETCGATFAITHSRSKFCPVCAPIRPVVKVALGQTFACENCSVVVVKVFRRQSYCPKCYDLRELNALPAYKAHKSESHSRRYQIDQEYRSRRNATALKGQNAKYLSDVSFSINIRMRTGIGASLAGQKRGRRWETLVGFSLADLMVHLERQFLPGMSWDNRADWHIDHIVPLSHFRFSSPSDSAFKYAWSLSNLRPIWADDNRRKWAKRILLL